MVKKVQFKKCVTLKILRIQSPDEPKGKQKHEKMNKI